MVGGKSTPQVVLASIIKLVSIKNCHKILSAHKCLRSLLLNRIDQAKQLNSKQLNSKQINSIKISKSALPSNPYSPLHALHCTKSTKTTPNWILSRVHRLNIRCLNPPTRCISSANTQTTHTLTQTSTNTNRTSNMSSLSIAIMAALRSDYGCCCASLYPASESVCENHVLYVSGFWFRWTMVYDGWNGFCCCGMSANANICIYMVHFVRSSEVRNGTFPNGNRLRFVQMRPLWMHVTADFDGLWWRGNHG